MSKRPESPHLAILWAAREGRGLRLTADDCWELAHDDAVARAALTHPEASVVYPDEFDFEACGDALLADWQRARAEGRSRNWGST